MAHLSGIWHWWILLPWNVWLDYADKIVKIAAVLIGGIWAYYGFFRARIHRSRLDTTISAEAFRKDGRDYLHVSILIKNVGSSSLSIRQDGTALEVFSVSGDDIPQSPAQALSISDSDWKWQATLPIFRQNAWIDSAEEAEDELLMLIPQNQIAVKIVASVIGGKFDWGATKILRLIESENQNTRTVQL
jgi:hypothetical protein